MYAQPFSAYRCTDNLPERIACQPRRRWIVAGLGQLHAAAPGANPMLALSKQFLSDATDACEEQAGQTNSIVILFHYSAGQGVEVDEA